LFGCECVAGVREGVYMAATQRTPGFPDPIFGKDRVYVCSVSVLYCIGVCGRREKRESENQTNTHIHTLLYPTLKEAS
jgi:hypothetical protein